jgi:hypothetical protein
LQFAAAAADDFLLPFPFWLGTIYILVATADHFMLHRSIYLLPASRQAGRQAGCCLLISGNLAINCSPRQFLQFCLCLCIEIDAPGLFASSLLLLPAGCYIYADAC